MAFPVIDKKAVGAIALQRDGHVGYVMDVLDKAVIVDGEEVRPEDVRVLRVGDGDIAIKDYAQDLGLDDTQAKAACEAVRVLRMKAGMPEVRKFTPPPAPYPVDGEGNATNTFIEGQRVRILQDLADDDTPLFAGDEGVVEKLSGGVMAFRSDRYKVSTSVSRIVDGEKRNILDFCELIPESPFADEEEVAAAIDGFTGALEESELDVTTMNLKGKRIRLNDGREGMVEAVDGRFLHFLEDGEASPYVISRKEMMSVIVTPVPSGGKDAIIESLRAEVKTLERSVTENVQLNAKQYARICRLEMELELEQKARRLAESVAALTPDAIPTPSPSPLRKEGKDKPYGAKVIIETTEERCELLWEDDWELMHSQFSADGKLMTLWRKVNVFTKPDGSPLNVGVALPTIESPLEETERVPVLSLQEVDAVLYGSVNTLTPQPPLPESEGEQEIEVLEIQPADVFSRFDDDILGEFPIKRALNEHGFDAVNAAMNHIAEFAGAEAYANSDGLKLANRPIHQFGAEAEKI